MFTHIGEKIKTLAAVICWLGIIGSVIGGIALIVIDEDNIAIGILVMLGGALVSWLGSFFAYGFGELVSNSEIIAKGMTSSGNKNVSPASAPSSTTTPPDATQTFPTDTASQGLKFKSNHDGTCYLSSIGSCTDAHVVIPYFSPKGETVTSIGSNAFSEYLGLSKVTIPSSITSIGESAFYSCKNLTKVVISGNAQSIGSYCFCHCANLTEIVIPTSVKNIGSYAFSLCPKITIKCEAASKPDGWKSDWVSDEIHVVWGYKA